MVNMGSPMSMQEVVNTVEHILAIREGQIKAYAKDPATGEWVAQSTIPSMSAPATAFATVAQIIPSGSAARLATNACKRCAILSHPDNTGRIYIGGSNVSDQNGIPLEPGQVQELAVANTDMVYATATINGEKLIVAYMR
jgi:hypothetical protein